MSPDGMYYWDGQRWASTLSPDGRFRWNGAAWEPVMSPTFVPAYGPPRPAAREPTSWTKPLQIAVIAWYGQSLIYSLFTPLWMGGYMSQVMQQSLQRSEQQYPPGQAPPPGFADMMSSMAVGSMWVGIIIGATIAVLAIIGAWRRWTWAYYGVLVLLGFSVFGFVFNLINLATGRALTANSVQPPEWTMVVAEVSGPIAAALFVWMLVAVIRRGPWGMRRVTQP